MPGKDCEIDPDEFDVMRAQIQEFQQDISKLIREVRILDTKLYDHVVKSYEDSSQQESDSSIVING